MKKFNIYIQLLLIAIVVSISGCGEDFLDKPPVDRVTADNFYQTPEELRIATAPLYSSVWFDYNKRPSYMLGDSRAGDLLSPYGSPGYYLFTVNSIDSDLSDAWFSFYKVIANSNVHMKNIAEKALNVPEVNKNAAIAETRFMRAIAYFYLVRLWGPVILIEDTETLVDDALLPLSPVEDVYQFIINDLKFAAQNLPLKDDPGRVTAWSAAGLLSKVYLARSGYGRADGTRDQAYLDSAKTFAGAVCKQSGFELMPNYGDLFKYENNVNKNPNNTESLFSLLWVPLGTWGSQNATLSDFTHSTEVTGGKVNVWSNISASYDILRSYSAEDSIRRNATFMTQNTHYPEINKKDGGYIYTGTGAPIKKYVPGGPDDNDGKVGSMNSPLNTYMLRLADVYLTYAEACLGNSPALTKGQEGWEYFDKVRKRAKVKEIPLVTLDSIMYERRMELGFESQRWYDMVTWSYFQPQKVLNIINSQERGTSYTCTKGPDKKLVIVKGSGPQTPPVATLSNIYFPYPETEVIQNPNFNKPPVPYDFAKKK